MSPETLKEQKEQEQTQEQQQVLQQPQVQQPQEIVEMIKKLVEDEMLEEIYNDFKKKAKVHTYYMLTNKIIPYLTTTEMYKYLYNVIKAHVVVIFSDITKVKELIAKLIEKTEKNKNIFDSKLFSAVLLTQLISKKNKKLVKYIQMYYFYKVVNNLANAYKLLANSNEAYEDEEIPQELQTLKEKVIIELEHIFVKDNTNIKLKERKEALKNHIIETIRKTLKDETQLNKKYIAHLKKKYKNNLTIKTYKLLKQYYVLKPQADILKKLTISETEINLEPNIKYFRRVFRIYDIFTPFIVEDNKQKLKLLNYIIKLQNLQQQQQ